MRDLSDVRTWVFVAFVLSMSALLSMGLGSAQTTPPPPAELCFTGPVTGAGSRTATICIPAALFVPESGGLRLVGEALPFVALFMVFGVGLSLGRGVF